MHVSARRSAVRTVYAHVLALPGSLEAKECCVAIMKMPLVQFNHSGSMSSSRPSWGLLRLPQRLHHADDQHDAIVTLQTQAYCNSCPGCK